MSHVTINPHEFPLDNTSEWNGFKFFLSAVLTSKMCSFGVYLFLTNPDDGQSNDRPKRCLKISTYQQLSIV